MKAVSASASAFERPSYLLGVARSVLDRPWHERCDAIQAQNAMAIAQRHGISDVLARVLAGRGVTVSRVESFLQPRLRDLMPDPNSLGDMPRAASRLAQAATKGEKIAIFGDYDVDGACSAALLAGYWHTCGLKPRIHIPDRITEGYGPNVEAIATLAGEGATLLVTVDCGTASHEPLAEATRLGLDVVVLDHHQAPPTLPAIHALVNPNRQDDLSGLCHLSAAGVVFLTLVALHRILRAQGFWQGREEPDLLSQLDLVALATIADVVPLQGLNRAFVRQGLHIMRERKRPGLVALFDAAGLDASPQPWHLGFLLGPRINAGGRIGNAALGAKLLLTQDPVEARRIAAELDLLNQDRQIIEKEAVAEAEAQALLTLDADPEAPLIVTVSPKWHQGVVGLIAARLKERFFRPAFAFTLRDGVATGSGRSIAGVDLGKVVRAAVEGDLAVKGGGHAMAAGATVAATKLDRFAAFLREQLQAGVDDARLGDTLAIDAVLSAGGATPDLVTALEQAGPFGAAQPEPVFAFPHHRIVDATEVGTGRHIRIRLRSGDGSLLSAIAFRAGGQPLGEALLRARGEVLHVAGTLSLDQWGGGKRAQLRIVDVALPEA